MGRFTDVKRAMRLDEQPTVLVSYLYGVLDAGFFYQSPLYKHLLVGLGFILMSAAAFLLNEYADKDTDSLQTDRLPSSISKEMTAVLVPLLSIAGLLLSFLGGVYHCALGMCLLGVLYSLPRSRFKARAALDLISLGICFVVLPYVAPLEMRLGITKAIALLPNLALNLLFLLLFLAACNLIAMIRDIGPDCRAGLRTTTVALGLRRSLLLGLATTFLAYPLGIAVIVAQGAWWYLPVLLFVPVVASIFGFGLGARLDPEIIRARFSSSAKAGIVTGNLLLLTLILVMLLVRATPGLTMGASWRP